MPAQLTGMFGRFQETARQFTVAQRTLAIIGVAAVLLGAIGLSSWLTKPTMSPLFANVSAADASAIVDQLDSAGVQYQLTDGGSTILVPQDKLYPMRLAVAAAGLPTASDGGYSLLDDMGMTSSEFQQQVTYQRALEGELAKTIGAIDGVQAATVRLALPKETVFVSEKADPTASVFIKTAPGATISGAKVQAIVHLVSAGIEGMAPADVAVIDADGMVLSAVGGAGGTGLQDSQAIEYESRVAGSVQAMLDRIVGVGNAVVSVNADLDYDQTERTSETFSADPAVPALSSATTLEQYTGSGSSAGAATGVLGPDNIAVPSDGATGGDYRKETATDNNAVNKVTEHLTTAPGSVRRQSISVVVSQDAAGGLDLTALEGMVAAAAGVVPDRGDVVSVSRMTFDTSTAEEAQAALAAAAVDQKAAQTTELIKTGAIAGVVLLIIVIALLSARRRGKRARREALDLGALDLIEARRAEALEGVEERRALSAAPVPEEQGAIAAKREDVMALAAEQPAEVAEMLRGWLVSGRR